MSSVVLVSAAWRRYDVTRLALAQRALLCGALSELGHEATSVIVADDENLEIASEFGFFTVEQTNDQLGRKFNDGLEFAARELEADYLVLIGSDDWAHPSLFETLPKMLGDLELPTPERPVVIGGRVPEATTGRQIAIVDLPTGRMRLCRVAGRFGVIPWIFPRTALEPSGFRPIADDCQRGIDGSLLRGLGLRPQWVWTDPHSCARVDFKSDVNLNSYETLSRAIGEGVELPAWEWLAEAYPVELVEQARKVGESLAAFPRENAAVAG